MMKYYVEQTCGRCKCKFTVEPTTYMQDRNGLLQLDICCPICQSYRYTQRTLIPMSNDKTSNLHTRSAVTLKMCPRCQAKRGRLRKSTAGGTLRYKVKCLECGFETEYMQDADAARIAWNCTQFSSRD